MNPETLRKTPKVEMPAISSYYAVNVWHASVFMPRVFTLARMELKAKKIVGFLCVCVCVCFSRSQYQYIPLASTSLLGQLFGNSI